MTKISRKRKIFRNFAPVMPIHIPINILDFIFKGMLIGVIASAPMGPVGILCVQRTLNKGRWFGFATGIGAAVSDIIYAAFAGFGMSFVMDFITNDQNGTPTIPTPHRKCTRAVSSRAHCGTTRGRPFWLHSLIRSSSSCSWPCMPSLPLCCPTIRSR